MGEGEEQKAEGAAPAGVASPASPGSPGPKPGASTAQVAAATGVVGTVLGFVGGLLVGGMAESSPPPAPSIAAAPPPVPSEPPAPEEPPAVAVEVHLDLGSEEVTGLEGPWKKAEVVDVKGVAVVDGPDAAYVLPAGTLQPRAMLTVVGRGVLNDGAESTELTVSMADREVGKWSVTPTWRIFDAELSGETGRIVFRPDGNGTFAIDWIDVMVPTPSVRVDVRDSRSRSRLLRGFHGVEGLETERPSVWSSGPESVVGVVLDPADGAYKLSMQGHAFHAIAPLEVGIVINDKEVGALPFEANEATVELTVPAGVLRRGGNELRLVYPTTAKPSRTLPNSNDDRDLALSLLALSLEPN